MRFTVEAAGWLSAAMNLREDYLGAVEALLAAVGQLLGTYTDPECANYFADAGYEQT
jgi:hypothetical protein